MKMRITLLFSLFALSFDWGLAALTKGRLREGLVRTNDNDRVMETKKKTKIFGVGLSKTGSATIAKAMEHFGYKTIVSDSTLDQFMHHPNTPPNLTASYDHADSVWDIPTAAYYQELLLAYPEAKFILLTQQSEAWFRSVMEDHEGGYASVVPERIQRLNHFVYGSRFPTKSWIHSYEQHNHDVESFFAVNAPGQLLVIDINTTEMVVSNSEFVGLVCTILEFAGEQDEACTGSKTTKGLLAAVDTGFEEVDKRKRPEQLVVRGGGLQQHQAEVEQVESVVAGFTGDDEKPFAYVTLLCDAANNDGREGYIRMLLVLKENIRQFDKANDIVVMTYGDINPKQRTLLQREGFKLVTVDTVGRLVSNPEPLRVPDDISACYRSKLNVLKLVQYKRVIFLDADILIKRDLQFLFDSEGFSGYEGYASPINAGLFAVEPSNQAFIDVKDLLLSDAFHPNDGWLNVGPFPHWRLNGQMSDWSFWCAHADQGILYYYFDKVVSNRTTILSLEDAAEVFSHFSGLKKPILHNPKKLSNLRPDFRDDYTEWYRLWDRVHDRLLENNAFEDYDNFLRMTGAKDTPENTRVHLQRTLRSLDHILLGGSNNKAERRRLQPPPRWPPPRCPPRPPPQDWRDYLDLPPPPTYPPFPPPPPIEFEPDFLYDDENFGEGWDWDGDLDGDCGGDWT